MAKPDPAAPEGVTIRDGIPYAETTRFRLKGEPDSDKGFVAASGRRYRARVVKGVDWVGTSSGPTQAPTRFTLYITVAALDDDGAVIETAQGHRISERREVTVGPENLSHPAFDIGALIDDNIAILVAQFELAQDRHDALAATLASWAVEVPGQAG